MSMFQCNDCGSVENTALCNYHYEVVFLKIPPVCSACTKQPKSYGNKGAPGEWHGRFDRVYMPMSSCRTRPDGCLVYSPTNESDYRKHAIKIVEYVWDKTLSVYVQKEIQK